MSWILLAHRSEVAKPGEYVLLSGSEQIAAANIDGEVIVHNNVCAHRQSKVLQGTCGTSPHVCPYHGRRGKATISRQWLTQWVGDWLFASEDGVTKIEDDLRGLYPRLASDSFRIEKRYSMDSMPMPCEWRVAVENTLEDIHVPAVHPDTFGKLKLSDATMEDHGKNSMCYYTIADERTVQGLERLSKQAGLVASDEYWHIFLWPFTCLSSVGGLSFSLQHYMPVHGYTQLHTRLYEAKRADNSDLGWFYNEAREFNMRVFRQDSEACARVVGIGGELGPGEERVKWFRETFGE